jgi:large subunit ribosomal protein L10
MSKFIKQMEMASLKETFKDVRDLAVLSVQGLTCQADASLRAALRKKKIRLKVVKNSLTRKVFGELGLNVKDDSPYWAGPTTLAWGAGSIAELCQAIDGELNAPKVAALYKDKVKRKGAIADGQEVPYEVALKMPTRQQAIAKVVTLALSPARRVASQIRGPAGTIAGQIKSLSEKKEGAPAEAAATT